MSVSNIIMNIPGGEEEWSPLNIASCRLCLDASDMSTLFTDTAATTAVTASGQTVKAWRDKTANATLFTEATNAPTYTEAGGLKYLVFTGKRLDSTLDMSSLNAMTICAAVRREAGTDIMLINQNNGSVNPGFSMQYNTAPAIVAGSNVGTTRQTSPQNVSAQPYTEIVTGFFRRSSALLQTRINGVNGTATTSSQGAGTWGNANVRISGRTSDGIRTLTGNIYALLLFTEILAGDDLTAVESWLAARSGVTL
jgi:hypothetical protein